MKRLMLAGGALFALIIMPTLPANAVPFGSSKPAVTQTDTDMVLVRHGRGGHHGGWGRGHGRGHHYGWTRGRHRR